MISVLLVVGGLLLGEGAWQWAMWFTRRYEREGAARTPWTRSRGLHGLTVFVVGAVAAYGARAGWSWADVVILLGSSVLLVTISLVDLCVRRIPNVMVIALIGWGLIRSLVTGHPSIVGWGVGLLAGGGVFLLIALVGRGAMGPGDVKLAAALGALVGYPAVWGMLLVGILAGGIVTLVLLLLRRVGRKDYMAYGPYLAFGGWAILLLQCGWNL